MAEPKGNKQNRAAQHSTRPVATSFDYRFLRKLERTEKKYERSATVEGIKSYVEEIVSFCEAEIEAGELADTPQVWEYLYSKLLVSVKGRANSLNGGRALYLSRTGGGRPGEREAFEEDQRELSRLASDIERQLDAARKHALPDKAEEVFVASRDYRSVRYKGREYRLTRNQSIVVKLLYEAYTRGTPAIGKSALLEAIEAETSRLRDSFRRSPLWRTLIVTKRRGTYQLNLTT